MMKSRFRTAALAGLAAAQAFFLAQPSEAAPKSSALKEDSDQLQRGFHSALNCESDKLFHWRSFAQCRSRALSLQSDGGRQAELFRVSFDREMLQSIEIARSVLLENGEGDPRSMISFRDLQDILFFDYSTLKKKLDISDADICEPKIIDPWNCHALTPDTAASVP